MLTPIEVAKAKRKFQDGDIVYLKNGSPKLIIIDNTGKFAPPEMLLVQVAWFDGSKECTTYYPEPCLTKEIVN
jgi:uncharacterized protein YodC (DUF2158 family)